MRSDVTGASSGSRRSSNVPRPAIVKRSRVRASALEVIGWRRAWPATGCALDSGKRRAAELLHRVADRVQRVARRVAPLSRHAREGLFAAPAPLMRAVGRRNERAGAVMIS